MLPIFKGIVIGSAVKHLPVSGSTVTKFIMQTMRDRGEAVPRENIRMVSQKVKERFCYTCPDIVKKYAKYDADPSKFQVYEGNHPKTDDPYKIDVGYERFLGPELFFNPEIYSTQNVTPLPQLVDERIQSCAIDLQRAMYENIVLSGGSTMFKDFARRLQRDIQRVCNNRNKEQEEKVKCPYLLYSALSMIIVVWFQLIRGSNLILKDINVKVIQHRMQRFAVWFGGSMWGSLMPEYPEMVLSREEYEEIGPFAARRNPIISPRYEWSMWKGALNSEFGSMSCRYEWAEC